MTEVGTSGIRTYALDTNVLIHDPNAVFKFEEHQVLIPMAVLEELDKLKVGASAVAADARQAVRTIDELLGAASPADVMKGVPLPRPDGSTLGSITILVASRDDTGSLSPTSNDNLIINDLISLKKKDEKKEVVLVTKDINMRLKARGSGLLAEDYHNDQLISDLESLATGYHHVEGSFWDKIEAIESQNVSGKKYHVLKKETLQAILSRKAYVNQFVFDDKEFVCRIYKEDGENYAIELLNTGLLMRQKAWGLSPRDLFQAMAMYLLFDPEIDLVALNGAAGSGKTILALACALEQTMETKDYKRILATRSTRGLDEDIGFLPGTEAEKMQPWLGAFTDNLEALHSEDFDPGSSEDYVGSKVPLQFKSLNFVRGRSFQQTFLIVDEAQNLTPHQVKTIVTRAGEGTKVVCLGNLAQIDTPYLGATSSGLTYLSERFKGFSHGGSITLQSVARSRLAAFAETHL
ncbi:PhoH family protein [Reinekea marinisedimentorum]|uniref:PhoH-like ATPase n=1 Tax=Reinekea marinisedimentorum TaxID=230495 RepID=A0A4V2UK39_9GAMM|nr:PhoH family protein [Reinekea marinisedimentorum]TCS42606.1 PhoH-like ATPase [Reinekea marinisedimentorum]